MKPEPRPALSGRIPDAAVFTRQGRGPMPVLMIAEQPNLDEGTYASMLEQLMPLLRSANGFMSHAGGPSPAGGMRMIEIWESETDSQKFFNENLKPNLPPGVVPDLTYYELHAAFTR
jgi:hypothetical protein